MTPGHAVEYLDPNLIGERIPFEEIPVIDFGRFRRGDSMARMEVAAQIGTACRDVGFLYVRNHGIAPALVRRTFAEAKRFFDLPAAVKQAIAIGNSACHRGYFAVGGENLDPGRQQNAGDLKEGIKIGRDLTEDHPLVTAGTPLHGPNQWPAELPGWKDAMEEYYAACKALGLELMHAFALALGLAENHFDACLGGPMATLGPLHYPPQAGAITEAQIGAGAHTDFGCLTILAQDDSGGLQVRNTAGRWIDAPPVENTFVVNIGDMMAHWTNDLFASTVHRVINAGAKERYSIPFFYDPEFHAAVACLETCQGPDNPPRYPPTTSGRHLLAMIDATFEYHRGQHAGKS